MTLVNKVILTVFILILLSCSKTYNFYPVESIYSKSIRVNEENKINTKILNDQQTTINALKEIHFSLINPISQHNYDFTQIKTDARLNKQFEILEHLGIQDSFNLDFVRFGSPLLYCYKIEPFKNYKEYSRNLKYNDIKVKDSPFLNRITIDDSAEGFFEFVILEKIGEQFLLSGHGNYNSLILITDSLEIDYIEYSINTLTKNKITHESGYSYVDTTYINKRTLKDRRFIPGASLIHLNKEEKNELYDLSLPIVSYYSSYVSVEFLSFTHWGGFFKETYYMKNSFPHKILKKVKKVIKEYNCGIRF